MKEQLAAGLSEGQIAELVENDEIHAGEIFGEPPLPAGAGLALQPVHEVDDGIEATPGAAADAGPRYRLGQMRLAGAEPGPRARVTSRCDARLPTGHILANRML